MSALRVIVCAAAIALAVAWSGPAAAQSSSGAIVGRAAPGTVVVLHNEGSGMHREVTVKKNGRYELRNLPTGVYSLVLRGADGRDGEPFLVTVRVGTATRIP